VVSFSIFLFIFRLGHDTTSSLLSFTFWHLSQHLEVQKELQAELDRVLNGRAVTPADLEELVYTRCILNEALRFHAPVPGLERVTTRPVNLMGYDLPAGITIGIRFQSSHFDDQFWPEPQLFKPERWIGQCVTPCMAIVCRALFLTCVVFVLHVQASIASVCIRSVFCRIS